MDNFQSALLRAPLFKSIDDPWIGFLVLGGFILISSILAMIVLCVLWRRHQKRSQLESESYMLANAPNRQRQVPGQMEETPGKVTYNGNSQRPDFFNPANGRDRIMDEIRTRFNPEDGFEQAQQFYNRANKAYF